MQFGTILRRLIAEHGITQKSLAAKLNLAPSTLGSYVQNTREPDFELLKRIADFFLRHHRLSSGLPQRRRQKPFGRRTAPNLRFADPPAAKDLFRTGQGHPAVFGNPPNRKPNPLSLPNRKPPSPFQSPDPNIHKKAGASLQGKHRSTYRKRFLMFPDRPALGSAPLGRRIPDRYFHNFVSKTI